MRIKKIAVFLLCIFLLSGCGASQDKEAVLPDVEVQETDVEENAQKTDEADDIVPEVSEAEELLDAFLAGEIPAYYDDKEETTIMYDQLPHDENDYLSYYHVGERVDLDNDGEVEQIVKGPYGGMYFDVRDGKVYVLAAGNGTAMVLSYTEYDNATWIVDSDTSHGGRQLFWLKRYDGGENIVDEFGLGAEYWDSPDGKYDENSTFTYRDEEISMSEYEELRKEIFGW